MNVNADSAAAAIAVAMRGNKLIVLSDVDGVLSDRDDEASLVSRLKAGEARNMVTSGAADKGMIPKLDAALFALENGVERVHLINGAKPNSLLVETFTDDGIGTMIVPD